MFLRLLFVLTFIPFIEIYFLVSLSREIGWTNTLGVIFVTGILGAWLLKRQGHSILMQVQQSTSQNQIPSDALAKGFFTFIGGLLLLTPGILTDAIGLSLIFPLTQILWKKYFVGQWAQGLSNGNFKMYSNFPGQGQRPQSPFGQQQETSRRIDPEVIDIKATPSETIKKD